MTDGSSDHQSDDLHEVDVPAMAEWTCNQFALSLGIDEVPEVLRRVASVIEQINDFVLLDISVTTCSDEATASVYYRRPTETD